MNMFNNLLKIDEAGNVFSEWVEWKHVTAGFLHCSTCLSLHKCWFHRKKMPICKQHEHCHCYVFSINSPIPNVNSKAECSIDKFTGYIFSEKYKWNGKMELFHSLGFTIEDSQMLKDEFEKQAVQKYCNGDYTLQKLNAYGQRINIVIQLQKNGREINFESGWMVREKGLVTLNTPLGD